MDGLNWQDIAVVFATSTPTPVNQYHYIDRKTVSGTVYYRLKQVDLDGRNMYSVIKSIHAEKPSTLARIFVSSQNTIAVELNEK